MAYAEGETEELTGVTVNDNVVTIKLSAPYGAFLNVLAQFAIYPEHLLAGADPLTIQVLTELYATTNQIGYLYHYFGDGAPVVGEAFARVALAAAAG